MSYCVGWSLLTVRECLSVPRSTFKQPKKSSPTASYHLLTNANIQEERRLQQRSGGSLKSRNVLPSPTIGPSLIAEEVSDIRSIDLRARLRTNLWHILGRISAWIYFLHLGYIYYGDAYILHVALYS
jgi:hypothetical protein